MPKYSSVTQSFRILIYLLKNYLEIISETLVMAITKVVFKPYRQDTDFQMEVLVDLEEKHFGTAQQK